jgi:Predicted extracellular nuclease
MTPSPTHGRAFMRLASIGGLLLAMLAAIIGAATPVRAAAVDLFFSEYIEGTSFNKALEIYNGTGASVDLSLYTVELYSNGAAAPSQSVTLSGMLADGDVFVLATAMPTRPSWESPILPITLSSTSMATTPWPCARAGSLLM